MCNYSTFFPFRIAITVGVKDVLIIGWAAAGLSVAVNLARSLYTVALFDSGVYRNHLYEHLQTGGMVSQGPQLGTRPYMA